MKNTIVKKILLFGVVSGVITLILACIGFGVAEFYKIKNESLIKLNSQIDILAYNLEPVLLFDDKDAADKTLLSLQEDPSVNRIRLYKVDGREFSSFIRDDEKADIKLTKAILYDQKQIGRLEIESSYIGIKERYITYFLISLLIIIVSIPAGYFISAPLRGQVSKSIIQSHQDLELRVHERTEELMHHIAARKKAQEEVESKRHELESLLYIVSHDLKEPLRSMEYFSLMVKDRYLDKLDEEGKDYFNRVIRAAARMRLLLEDILTISRARNMGHPVNMFDGKQIVEEAVGRLDAKIKETNAVIKIAPTFPAFKVERTWAVHAAFNLISNALKYAKEGEAPDIEVDPYPAENPTGIIVRDRGTGVKPEYAEKIFELFQRAVGREIDGTGAGLAIVREVARRHGGKTWVQPRDGGGAEFIITFSS